MKFSVINVGEVNKTNRNKIDAKREITENQTICFKIRFNSLPPVQMQSLKRNEIR